MKPVHDPLFLAALHVLTISLLRTWPRQLVRTAGLYITGSCWQIIIYFVQADVHEAYELEISQ